VQRPISKNLLYAGISIVLGGLLVYEKFANDVVDFDGLASVCSDQVAAVEFESGRRYNRIRFTVPNMGEAVLRKNPNGFSAAAKAVAESRSYCFRFDPNGRTKSVYHFTVNGETVMEYSTIAGKRRFNVNGLFLIGSVLLFGVGPFYLFQQYRGQQKSLY
jgi:hypothetical protein